MNESRSNERNSTDGGTLMQQDETSSFFFVKTRQREQERCGEVERERERVDFFRNGRVSGRGTSTR